MPNSKAIPVSVEAAQTTLWEGVVTGAAVIFSLRTAWHLWSIRPDYQRVVVRDGLPPIYALVILAAALVTIFAAYVPAAALWLRRRWANRAIIWYAVLSLVSRVFVRMYFLRGRNVPLFGPDEYAFMVSLLIVTIAASVAVDKALGALPAPEVVPKVPVPRWENVLTLVVALPPIIFAARVLMSGGSIVSDEGDGGSLSRLAWVSLPIVLMLAKRGIDSLLSLRPAPRAEADVAAARATVVPGTYMTPRDLAEFFVKRSVTRIREAPDSLMRTLRMRGLDPRPAPPEYGVELLMYGVFVHDIALLDREGTFSDDARGQLWAQTRDVANGILADVQREGYSVESWDQFVARRYADYSTDAPRTEPGTPNHEQYLMTLCTKIVRYATKSHVPNPRATKLLAEFFGPELVAARTAMSNSILVDDA